MLYDTLVSQSNGTSRNGSLVYPRQFVEAVAKYRDPTLGIKEFYDPGLKLDKPSEERGAVVEKAVNFGQVLVKILSDKKYDLTAFFIKLVDVNQGDISKGIDIDIVNDAARSTFSKLLSKDELNIFTDGLDANNSSKLDFSEIIAVLGKAMKDKVDRFKAYFALTAASLDKRKMATGKLGLLLEDFFISYGLYPKTKYIKDQFVERVMKIFSILFYESSEMFEFFADGADTVPGSDLYAAVNKYRKVKVQATSLEPEVPPIVEPKKPDIEPAKPIRKPEKLTPDQEAELVKKFKATLAKRNLNFEHLFNMADPDDNGTVSVIGLRNAIKSQVPDFSQTDLFNLLKVLDKNKNGAIDIEEYEAIMLTDKEDLKSISDNDSRVELRKSQLGSQKSISNASAASINSRSAHSGAKNKLPSGPGQPKPLPDQVVKNIDPRKALGEIILNFQKKEIVPASLYDWTDTDGDKILPTMRLYKELVINLEVDKGKIGAAVKLMDVNSSGYVLRGDFINFMNPQNIPQDGFVTAAIQGDQAVSLGLTIGDFKGKLLDESIEEKKSGKGDGKEKSKAFKIKGSNKVIPVPNKFESLKNSIINSGAQTPAVIKFTRKMDDTEFQSVVREIKEAFLKSNISAITLFSDIAIVDDPSFPEPPGTEKAATIKLFEAICKAIPDFDKFKIRAVLHYIDIEKSGIISREEFDLVFGVNPDTGAMEDSRLTVNENTDKMKADIDAIYAELKNLQMAESDIFFKACDTDGDGAISILDIKAALMLLLEEEKKHLIVPFIRQVKKLFKTDMIDDKTLFKLFSTQFPRITDLRDYRAAMLKLRDMANNDQKRFIMKTILHQCDVNKDGILTDDELVNALTKMNLGIRDDIKQMIAEDIVILHEGLTVDSFFTFLSSVIKDRAAVNNVKYFGELIYSKIQAKDKAGITSQALTLHLKSIKKSSFF